MQPLKKLAERLEQLEIQRGKSDEVSGVKIIRQFLLTGEDAYPHLLLSPEPTGNMRWHFFGKKDNTDVSDISPTEIAD
jgi:hypothetical protein